MFDSFPNLPASIQPRDAFTEFLGGLNEETPAWTTPPGMLRDTLNYEVAINGGYQDIAGYERFDGRTRPSEASFTILDVTITGSIDVGDTVTGANTGATGVVIAKSTYPDDPTQTYLVLTKVTGAWDDDSEDVEVTASVEGNTDADGYADSAPTSKLIAQYKNLAADEYRGDIAAVTGQGDVWGVFTLGSTKYALRDKVGGATAGLYKSSASGWTEVSLGYEVAFTSGGTYEIAEGDTITGGTSGETATVERVQVTSGSWAGGDAAGYLTLSGPSGAFQAEDLDVGANANVATIGADLTTITLQPSGRLNYDKSNFANPQGASRVYAADGVNLGWEFDGSVFAFIRTGMEDDTPDHVKVHKNQLFFSFDGSLQHSGISTPFVWSVVLGASEIATGFHITGLQTEPGEAGNSALLVACRQKLFILYGTDSSNWDLIPYRAEVGAYEWTIQTVAYTMFLDDHGITDFMTTQRFGNFSHSALSNLVRKYVNARKTLAVASCVVRAKNQYRIFFSDSSALYVTMNGSRVMGMMPVQLNDEVTCICSEEAPDGSEEIYFGSDDGVVYQLDKGTSFDGDNILAYMYTHFDNVKSIEWIKEFFAPVTIEAKGTGYAEFNLGYQLDYNRAEVSQPNDQTAELPAAAGAYWDTGLMWDTGLTWDDSSIIPSLGLDLRGEGRNISWGITKDSDYFAPLLLSGIHYRYLRTTPVRG